MKKIFFVLAISAVLFITIAPALALAQDLPLVRCGLDLGSSGEAGECNFCDLINLIRRVFMFIVWVAAPVVTLLLAWAGLKLIIYGNNDTKRGEAKQLLKDALIGFLWVILAGSLVNLILVTLVAPRESKPAGWWWGQSLNCPKTPVNLSVGTAPPGVGVVPSQPGGGMTSEQKVAAEKAVRSELSAANVSVNREDWCAFSGQSGCTDVSGLNRSTIDYVKSFKTTCGNCAVVITGGSESGVHSGEGAGTHAGGDKVDIRPNANVDAYVKNNFQYAGTRTGTGAGDKYTDPKTEAVWVREGDHWDVQVTKRI